MLLSKIFALNSASDCNQTSNLAQGHIVEDEVHLLRPLQRKLAQLWPELCIVATCQNGRVALEAIKTYQPQLVFLDIQLGDIDGLRLAETLPANCALVFVTAFADFALPVFEQGAVDYLLKPSSAARDVSAQHWTNPLVTADSRRSVYTGARPVCGLALSNQDRTEAAMVAAANTVNVSLWRYRSRPSDAGQIVFVARC